MPRSYNPPLEKEILAKRSTKLTQDGKLHEGLQDQKLQALL